MEKGRIKFLNRSWKITVTRNMSVFTNAIASAGLFKYGKKFNALPLEVLYVTKDNRLSYAYINEENYDRYCEDLEKLYKKPALLKELENTYHRHGKSLWEKSEKLSKNPSRQNYLSFVKTAKVHSAGLQISTVIGIRFYEILNKKLRQFHPDLSQQEIEILMSEITYPEKEIPLVRAQKALVKIGIELQKVGKTADDIFTEKRIEKMFRDYLNNFSIIPANFMDEPWTEKESIDQLRTVMKKDCQKELANIEEINKKRKIQSRKILAKIKSQEIKNLAKSIQLGTYLNEYRKYIICRANLAYRPMFQEIARKYNLSDWRECWKLTPDELEKLYFDADKNILKLLKPRNIAGVCFSYDAKGFRLMTRKEIDIFLSTIKKEKVLNNKKSEKEIKGIIANKGIIRGAARVISGKSEFHKFRDGDIIVTAMTSVDFVPLMKRASAYVTNEGGITNHAAIVSRELGKPCIVGTKNATEILKDGDLVEVDANKGVVKIIKRK